MGNFLHARRRRRSSRFENLRSRVIYVLFEGTVSTVTMETAMEGGGRRNEAFDMEIEKGWVFRQLGS